LRFGPCKLDRARPQFQGLSQNRHNHRRARRAIDPYFTNTCQLPGIEYENVALWIIPGERQSGGAVSGNRTDSGQFGQSSRDRFERFSDRRNIEPSGRSATDCRATEFHIVSEFDRSGCDQHRVRGRCREIRWSGNRHSTQGRIPPDRHRSLQPAFAKREIGKRDDLVRSSGPERTARQFVVCSSASSAGNWGLDRDRCYRALDCGFSRSRFLGLTGTGAVCSDDGHQHRNAEQRPHAEPNPQAIAAAFHFKSPTAKLDVYRRSGAKLHRQIITIRGPLPIQDSLDFRGDTMVPTARQAGDVA
jgi:hypothetical protein